MRHRGSTTAGLAILALCAMAMVACNILGPAGYFIMGPEKTKPQFLLDPKRSTVIFVDDRASVLPNRTVRQHIAKAVEKVLLEGKAVMQADIIDSDAILAYSTRERFAKPQGIAEVGRAVSAQVVVYATVDTFTLSADGAQFQPIASVRVKVIDAVDGRRLWPGADPDPADPAASASATPQVTWAPVNVNLTTQQGTAPTNSAERTSAELELADRLGRAIGRLFVEYVAKAENRIGE